MSKQVTKSHVKDTVHMYLVNWGAMLTHPLRCPCWMEASQIGENVKSEMRARVAQLVQLSKR